jgi:hypothetical protein
LVLKGNFLEAEVKAILAVEEEVIATSNKIELGLIVCLQSVTLPLPFPIRTSCGFFVID